MSEKVEKGKVVGFTYELKNDQGNTMEKSDHPLEYLHGNNNIIPGLENKLEGMQVGETKNVKVAPADAYGELNNELVFEVPRDNFPPDVEITPGMQFQTDTEDGTMIVTVKEVTADKIVVDGNHPLAGQTLHFDVKIDSIREATEQERDHGHVHQGGHNH
jgi:FKBP-type peptidyl-prolyl cis-trans isomerase SlyD